MIFAFEVGVARTKDDPTTRKFALFADFPSWSRCAGRSAFLISRAMTAVETDRTRMLSFAAEAVIVFSASPVETF